MMVGRLVFRLFSIIFFLIWFFGLTKGRFPGLPTAGALLRATVYALARLIAFEYVHILVFE